MAEWTNYSCNLPGQQNEGLALSNVHHVAHVADARRIIEDGRLRAGLVYDESRLNTTRTSVTWVSPNTWGLGSIYGNVQFTFNWDDILGQRDIYWVEVMTRYNPHAYRFLLTDNDVSHLTVTKYDASIEAGPLRRNDGIWYRNHIYTGEFMIDGNVPLQLCKRIKFISHNEHYCRPRRNNCPDMRQAPSRAAGHLVAHVLANKLKSANGAFLETEGPNAGQPTDDFSQGLGRIQTFLSPNAEAFQGDIDANESATSVLIAALGLYANENYDDAKNIGRMLASREVFDESLTNVVKNHFGIEAYNLPWAEGA